MSLPGCRSPVQVSRLIQHLLYLLLIVNPLQSSRFCLVLNAIIACNFDFDCFGPIKRIFTKCLSKSVA